MATINVRMPESLKRNGTQVFERFGVSTTQAVCCLFKYVEKEQQVPDWMLDSKEDKYDYRRRLLREVTKDGLSSLSDDDTKPWHDHLFEKYGEGLERR